MIPRPGRLIRSRVLACGGVALLAGAVAVAQEEAASAAAAAIDHVYTWVNGTAEGDWVSMAVPSDGSYGIAEGVIYSYPVTTAGGEYSIVQGLDVSACSRGRIDASHTELLEERDGVKDLL
jgi:malate dehydrogenase